MIDTKNGVFDRDIPYEYSETEGDNSERNRNIFSFNKHEQDLQSKPFLNMENMQKLKQDKSKFQDKYIKGKSQKEITQEYTKELVIKIMNAKVKYNQK